MSFQNLEALALILVFLTPGALFIYVCTLGYSPSMRGKYLREQFPLELTIFYLVVSTVVHSVLVSCTLGIMWAVRAAFPQVHPLEYLISVATRVSTPSPEDISFVVTVIILYFFASLALAYWGARQFSRYLARPTPLWLLLLAKMKAEADVGDDECRVQIQLREGESEPICGALENFQGWGDDFDSFQILVSQNDVRSDGGLGRVWVDSRGIRKMELRSAGEKVTFLSYKDKES